MTRSLEREILRRWHRLAWTVLWTADSARGDVESPWYWPRGGGRQ